jgi:hypothetical protein
MIRVPKGLKPLFDDLTNGFAKRATGERVVFLMLAAVLVCGDRTVSAMVRLLGWIDRVNPSTYHRVLSHRRWNATRLAKIIVRFIVNQYAAEGAIRICGDETVDGHRGKRVYGKGRHRDAVRSSHSHTVFRYGHKWVVLAILVQLPLCGRPFALPVLVALYRDPKTDRQEGRRHKTPVQLMCGLLRLLLRWFPGRKWRFAGDGGYGTHEFARFADRYRKRLTLVSKFAKDANLHRLPPPRRPGASGRPRTKGKPMAKPETVVARSRKKKLRVGWYGGGTRRVEIVTGTGHWYKSGFGLVRLRWVYVRDLDGTHRDEYFFSTDVAMTPKAIIELYGARWNIETTFQELRSRLGLETTRGWSRLTVLRMAPCLIVMYTLVVLFYDQLGATHQKPSPSSSWLGKKHLTFSDMHACVRRYLWIEWVFANATGTEAVQKLSRPLRRILEYSLTQAV